MIPGRLARSRFDAGREARSCPLRAGPARALTRQEATGLGSLCDPGDKGATAARLARLAALQPSPSPPPVLSLAHMLASSTLTALR